MKLTFNIEEVLPIISSLENTIPSNYFQKVENVVIDSRSPLIKEHSIFFAFRGAISDGHEHLQEFYEKGGRIAVVERIDLNLEVFQIRVENVLYSLQELSKAHRLKFKIPLLAITGSNGKTIVKEWLYYCLKENFRIIRSPKSYNSQLGVALSLLEIQAHHNLAIIEVGISQPGEMNRLHDITQPTIGIFTGIGEAHSVNFSSLNEKRIEKFKLFQNCEAFFEPNDRLIASLNFLYSYADRSNASLVYQVAEFLGMNEEMVLAKLKNLPKLAMRMEKHWGKDNTLLINDTYSADINSLANAVQLMKQESESLKRILVLSDFTDSEFDLKEINTILENEEIDTLIFIGEKHYDFKIANLSRFDSVDAFLESVPQISDAVILIKGSRKAGFENIVGYFLDKKHVSRLVVDLAAIRENYRFFKRQVDIATKMLVMVKAQAYGGGILPIAHLLEKEQADYLGVAYSDEGTLLRKSGITLPILVMNAERNAFVQLIEHELEPSIYCLEQLDELVAFLILKGIKDYPIHIKLDTGMNRLGFQSNDLQELIDFINAQPEVRIKSVFSHLAASDLNHEKEFTFEQIRKFEIETAKIENAIGYDFLRHIANTSAILSYTKSHFDMVRMGIGLFGFGNTELQNAITFYSEISQIKLVKKGESIGYSRNYIANEDMYIGIVPVGYADGIRRDLGKTDYCVLVNNSFCRIVGNVCMDMLMIELPNANFSRGQVVEIFGNNVNIEIMAQALNTINYEIISGVSDRVQRVYTES